MNLLIDSDAVFKISAAGLIGRLHELLGSDPNTTFVLSAAKHMIWKDKGRLKRKYTADGLGRALEFLLSSNSVPVPTDLSERDHLISVAIKEGLRIEGGEALLFAATAQFDEFVLVTGDKNSLEALEIAPGCHEIRNRLKSRVYCLEQVIAMFGDLIGDHTICQCVTPVRSCDEALRVIFSDSNIGNGSVRYGLRSYVVHLRSRTGDLLVGYTP